MPRMLLVTIATSGFLFLTGLSVTAAAAELAIEVRGVRSDTGRIYVAVHDSRNSSSFPYAEDMFAGLQQEARKGTIRFVFRDLPAGRYALSAFHDENDNAALDADALGIPHEGFGFANDPPSNNGPASFEAASVSVGDGPVTTVLTMSY